MRQRLSRVLRLFYDIPYRCIEGTAFCLPQSAQQRHHYDLSEIISIEHRFACQRFAKSVATYWPRINTHQILRFIFLCVWPLYKSLTSRQAPKRGRLKLHENIARFNSTRVLLQSRRGDQSSDQALSSVASRTTTVEKIKCCCWKSSDKRQG